MISGAPKGELKLGNDRRVDVGILVGRKAHAMAAAASSSRAWPPREARPARAGANSLGLSAWYQEQMRRAHGLLQPSRRAAAA
jgi:hypothetical protein